VPHSKRFLAPFITSFATFTIASRLRWLSASVAPSGAMSRSWKHQWSIRHFVRNSAKTSTRRAAFASESVPSSHGMRAVGAPNGSARPLRMVCQYAEANRKWSRIGLPSTFSSGR
jgi:hypothetical protein